MTLRIVPPLGFSLCPILWIESKSCRRRHPSPSISWFLQVWVCRSLWFRSPLSIELHPSPRTFLATKLCPSLPANFSDPLGSCESFLNTLLCNRGFRKVHGDWGPYRLCPVFYSLVLFRQLPSGVMTKVEGDDTLSCGWWP